MKDLKLYNNYNGYQVEEPNLRYPHVASTSDDDSVWFKESYLIATYFVTSDSDSGGSDPISPEPQALMLTNEQTTMSLNESEDSGNKTSRMLSYFKSSNNRMNEIKTTSENTLSIEEMVQKIKMSQPMTMSAVEDTSTTEPTIIETFNLYTEGSSTTTYGYDWSCECNYTTNNDLYITKPFNKSKIIFNEPIDPSKVYIKIYAYGVAMEGDVNVGDSTNNCSHCEDYNNNNQYLIHYYFSDLLSTGCCTTNDNMTFEFVDLYDVDQNMGIKNIDFLSLFFYMILTNIGGYPNIKIEYEDSFDYFYPSVSYKLVIDDEFEINAIGKNVNLESQLQVMGENFGLPQVSSVYINGKRQNSVNWYYNAIIDYTYEDVINWENNNGIEYTVKIVTNGFVDASGMFDSCQYLKSVDFKNIICPQLYSTQYMFNRCYSLIELKNLEYFDTSNVINMRYMFQECYSIGCVNGRGLKPNYGGGESSVNSLGLMTLSNDIQTYESSEPEITASTTCGGGIIDVKHNNNCSTSYFAPTYDSYVSINAVNGTSKLTFNGDVDENNDAVVCICISRNSGSSPEPVSLNASSDDDCEYIEDIIYVPLSSFTKVSGNEFQFNNNVIHQIEQDLYSYITHISFIGASYECMNSGAAPSNGGNYSTNIPLECCIETQLYCECVYCTFDLSKLNVSNVQNMSRMFQYCNSVHYINMSTWNTSNVISMYEMFLGCNSLLELDFSNFNLGNLTDFGSFISNCYSLEFINMDCYMNPNTDYGNNSYNFKKNGTIILNENYTYNEYFLNNLHNYGWNILPSQIDYKLTIVENGLEVTESTVLVNGEALTYNSESNKWEGVTLNIDSSDDANVVITYNDNEYNININSKYLFVGDNNSSYSGFNITETILVSSTSTSYSFIYTSYTKYIDIILIDGVQVIPTSNYYFDEIGEHTIQIIMNTSKVTDMSSMFNNCNGLTKLDLSSFDTSKVTDMSGMFNYCSGLISLDLSNFDTSNVTDMCWMFQNCNGLTSLDLSSFDTSKVTNMSSMFYNCTSLTSITMLGNVSKVTSYNNMFYNTSSNLIFNYDCNYDYSKLLNYNDTRFESYANCITKEQTWLVKIYDYSTNSYLSDLTLTLSNGVQGVYDETKSVYTFKFTNVKDVPTYDILMNNEVIEQIRCDQFNYCLTINLSGNYIKEKIYITSTSSTYSLINGTYLSYINEMYIDSIKQDTIVSSYTFNEVGKHEIIYIFDSEQTLTSCANMFSGCTNLTSITFSDNFNTSNVDDMRYMFYKCYDLISLDLSNFDTSNVTDMNGMFSKCNSLTSLDLSDFDTSKVTDISSMFYNCYNLTSLKLPNNVYILDSSMFGYCNSLEEIYIPSSVTSLGNSCFLSCTKLKKVTYDENCQIKTIGESAFKNCNSLEEIYIPSSVTSLGNSCFQECRNAIKLTFDENSNLTELPYQCFYLCENIKEVILPPLSYIGISCFHFCSKLEKVIINNNLPKNTMSIAQYAFRNCESLKEIYLYPKYVNIDSNTFYGVANNGILYYLDGCNYSSWLSTNTYYLGYYGWEGKTYTPTSYTEFNAIGNNVTWDKTSTIISYTALTNCITEDGKELNNVIVEKETQSSIFEQNLDSANTIIREVSFNILDDVKTLSIIQGKYVDYNIIMTISASSTSSTYKLIHSLTNVTKMSIDDIEITPITSTTFDIIGEHSVKLFYDYSNVTYMSYMFSQCSGLTSLDLSNFDTYNVTNMTEMFNNCRSLTSIKFGNNFDTSNVTNMSYMFSNCSGLTSLNVTNFDTSKVTDMYCMFSDCSKLTSLNLNSFNTSKVTSMSWMFGYCSNLTSIKFGYNSDVSKVTSYGNMFFSVPSTCTLTLCNNTKDGWSRISKPSNTVYIDCTDPSLEINE